MELQNVMPDIFLLRISQYFQFSSIGSQNGPIWTHPVKTHGRIIKKVSKLFFAFSKLLLGCRTLNELPEASCDGHHHFQELSVGFFEFLREDFDDTEKFITDRDRPSESAA